MRLPVFVIHWNAPDWCEETVRSLQMSEGVEVDITVIDNCSDRLPVLPESVTVDLRPKNTGYAGAANRAIDLASIEGAPAFALASHDVTVSPLCLAQMIDLANRSTQVGIVGPSFGTETVQDGWLSGSLMLVRMTCVRDVGRFDPIFGSYCEEVDYCHRAIRRGWQLAVAPARANTHGTRHSARARLLMDVNFTLLAAKEGDWGRMLHRIGGMVRRCVLGSRGHWCRALALTLRQLARYTIRTVRAAVLRDEIARYQ
jgi:GT2 family glycosyltransferase